MTKSVTVKCSRSSDELTLFEPEGLRQRDGSEYFRVSIKGHNLTASSKVYAFEPHSGIGQFFENLADNWRGWEGERKWTSLEGELGFVCTSDSLGHIAIEVTLKSYTTLGGWSVTTTIYIDAGQLEQIALDIKQFFNV